MPRARTAPEAWVAIFLDSLREMPIVSQACRAAGISREVVYQYRNDKQWFAKAWDAALEDGVDRLEQHAWEAAQKGDRQLMIFLLKSLRPARYRESYRPPPIPKPAPPMIMFKKVPARPKYDPDFDD